MNISELAKFRGGVGVDTISELSSASGVTVDGVLLKDGIVTAASGVSTSTITESASGSGVTVDGVLLKDSAVSAASGVSTNTITEYYSGSGVTIDSLLIKDGAISATAITGRNDGALPSSGKIGELASGIAAVALNTSTFTTMSTITLGAGEWDLSFVCHLPASASAIEVLVGIATSSNTNTGHTLGFNALASPVTATTDGSISVPRVPISASGTVTYYLTGKSFGGAVTPPSTWYARRVG
jgi:hypothetical protein